jgi:hypothetical protein
MAAKEMKVVFDKVFCRKRPYGEFFSFLTRFFRVKLVKAQPFQETASAIQGRIFIFMLMAVTVLPHIKVTGTKVIHIWSQGDKNNDMRAGMDVPCTGEFCTGTKSFFDGPKEHVVNVCLVTILQVQEHRPLSIPCMGVKTLQVKSIVLLHQIVYHKRFASLALVIHLAADGFVVSFKIKRKVTPIIFKR